MSIRIIHSLKISNYRSINVLELKNILPFAVFIGPNNSGKSNFFDALNFVSLVVQFGIDEALKQHGGWENIRCIKRNGQQNANEFEFEIELDIFFEVRKKYRLHIEELDSPAPKVNLVPEIWEPDLSEIIVEGRQAINSIKRETEQLKHIREKIKELEKLNVGRQPKITSQVEKMRHKLKLLEAKSILSSNKVRKMFFNIDLLSTRLHKARYFFNSRLYRLDARRIKEEPETIQYASELNSHGHNIAAVLRRLEKDDEKRETILYWLKWLAPELKTVHTEVEHLTGGVELVFREVDVDSLLPARSISNGIIRLLCLLVVMYDKPALGMTLIEEPERGLDYQTIIGLVNGFREQATVETPFWLTAYNEDIVKILQRNEVWLVGKKNGETYIKPIQAYDVSSYSLDSEQLCDE